MTTTHIYRLFTSLSNEPIVHYYIEMPIGAFVLSAFEQNDGVYISAMINTDQPLKCYTFIVVGTDIEIPSAKSYKWSFIHTLSFDGKTFFLFQEF
jgi:hypothetical protein